MTTINDMKQGYKIDLSQVKRLADVMPESAVRKLTPQQMADMRKIQELAYTRATNLQDHGSQKVYAEVKVGGRTMATLYNNGTMMTSNADHGKVMRALKDDTQLSDPAGAQERAEKIAAALGGTIVKGPDALTPQQYKALPPIEFAVDYEAMESDRKAAEARSASAETLLQTQVIAQQDKPEEVAFTAADEQGGYDAVEEFLEFAAMTPEEKMRYLILRSLGMTEEELAQMSPEARAAVEEEIAQKMKEQIRQDMRETQSV